MRLGWDEDALNAPELASRAEEAGVQMITVHGRTRCSSIRAGPTGAPSRRSSAAVSMPVVANGDVASTDDAAAILEQSGADAVMIGRAQLRRALGCRRRWRGAAGRAGAARPGRERWPTTSPRTTRTCCRSTAPISACARRASSRLVSRPPCAAAVAADARDDHDLYRSEPRVIPHCARSLPRSAIRRRGRGMNDTGDGEQKTADRRRADRAERDPEPGHLVDADGVIVFANCRGGGLLPRQRQLSARNTLGALRAVRQPAADAGRAGARAPRRRSTNTASTSRSPRLGVDKVVDLYVAPVPELPGSVVVVFQERSMADKIDRQLTHRGAARSVTGLAAMLAHEIKNPLSGIRGAAQLLETVGRRRRPGADPADPRRDRPHRLAGRPHGGLLRRAADRPPSGQHPRRAGPREGRRQERLCPQHPHLEDYDPSLPPVYANRDQLIQVFLNLIKNAAEARRRQAGRRDHAVDRLPARHPPLGAGRAGASRCRSSSASTTMGRACRPTCCRILFDPFITTKPTAPGSAWRWSPRSSATTAASSNATVEAERHDIPRPDAGVEGTAGGMTRSRRRTPLMTAAATSSSPTTTPRSARCSTRR